MIVQAAKEYADPSGWARDEDVVNKEAGRYALARFAGANVQYLVPRAPGDAYGYLLRLQAATYDLLFAHSGIAPIPSDALKEAFPDPARRPDGHEVTPKAGGRELDGRTWDDMPQRAAV